MQSDDEVCKPSKAAYAIHFMSKHDSREEWILYGKCKYYTQANGCRL